MYSDDGSDNGDGDGDGDDDEDEMMTFIHVPCRLPASLGTGHPQN